ncbi:flavodoxin family protein [Nocardioides sediminis]|uniref:flavodoxin family protein n=1 Tax=Nocardioides sediminis TaxID=433648 RepID=UPI000D31B110|nr:NAD(P)H-dependent oxidoreductase [Nocardioides sediminis]
MPGLNALALVCTLKPSPAASSSELIARQVLGALEPHGVQGRLVRVADHDVRFGVSTDEGDGDEWPHIRDQVLAADIVVISTPIWMGQPASVAKMVMERLDAELSETDEDGRPSMSGKVALVAVVGNEDGAHHVVAECLQALNDVGFSVPAQAGAYWVGEAMQSTDYRDLDETPETTHSTITTAAAGAAHLATLLRDAPYPPP